MRIPPLDPQDSARMAVRLRRPTDASLSRLLERSRLAELTYEPTGCSLGRTLPPGMRRRQWRMALPKPDSFERGVIALTEWTMHRAAGLGVMTDGPLMEGTNVAMSAPLPVGFVDATCRIVRVVDEEDRFGFAYGTLEIHPERGEESFVLDRKAGIFTVEAVSTEAHPLARLAPPVARRLQSTAVNRYLSAMKRATS
jgi:uncharacterized protein (UPF0548 family)